MFAELLIKTIRTDDMLSIVAFGTTARVVQPMRRMCDEAKVRDLLCHMKFEFIPYFSLYPQTTKGLEAAF